MKAIPSLPCLRTGSEVFLPMLQSRLQQLCTGAERVVRCRCGLKAVVGAAIDHHHYISNCPSESNYVGHKVVTEIMRKMYAQLEVPIQSEPTGLVWGTEHRPADILVLVPAAACTGAGRPVALDVGVTDAGSANAVKYAS